MSKGGDQTEKDVMNYRPPRGPRNINDPKSPSLHGDGKEGDEYCGTQNEFDYRPQSSGGPGLGGKIKSVQGRH